MRHISLENIPVRVESASRASTTGPAPCPRPQSARAKHSQRYLWSTVVPKTHTVRSWGKSTAAVVQAIAPAWTCSASVAQRMVHSQSYTMTCRCPCFPNGEAIVMRTQDNKARLMQPTTGISLYGQYCKKSVKRWHTTRSYCTAFQNPVPPKPVSKPASCSKQTRPMTCLTINEMAAVLAVQTRE